MHQIQFGALIFMLSQQRKINALRCFCAISERLVHPKNQRTWCQKISKVQKINAPGPSFGTSILVSPMSLGAVILVWDNPYVHRFWVADTPGASILARRSPRVY